VGPLLAERLAVGFGRSAAPADAALSALVDEVLGGSPAAAVV
jgi:hypothetical protein